MNEFLTTQGSEFVIGIVGSIVIISILGYIVDWILTLARITNARTREFVMVGAGFFAGMSIFVLLTGLT